MATAEQMALVALQYCIGSEAQCPPLLMMIVPVKLASSYWLVLEISDGYVGTYFLSGRVVI